MLQLEIFYMRDNTYDNHIMADRTVLGSDERIIFVRSSCNCNGCGACLGEQTECLQGAEGGAQETGAGRVKEGTAPQGRDRPRTGQCLSSKSSMVSEEHRRQVETFFTSEEVSRVCPNISESILVLGGRRIRRTKKNASFCSRRLSMSLKGT